MIESIVAFLNYMINYSRATYVALESMMNGTMSGPDYLLVIIFFTWMFPLLAVLFSVKTSFKEKFAWIMLVTFFTWIAWFFYLFLAPIRKPKPSIRI